MVWNITTVITMKVNNVSGARLFLFIFLVKSAYPNEVSIPYTKYGKTMHVVCLLQ